MPFVFTRTETIQEQVRRIFNEQGDHALTQLSFTGEEQLAGIHETRKTIKRLRALLHLVRDSLGETGFQAANGRLRQISQRLAPLREADALLELTESLKSEPLPPVFYQVEGWLLENQTNIRQQLLVEDDVPAAAAAEIRAVQADLDRLVLPEGRFELLAGGARRVYQQGQRRMARAYSAGDSPELFHDWRKRVKHLWHHLELLTPLWPLLFLPLGEECHRLSDILGDAHDMAELHHLLTGPTLPIGGVDELRPLLDLLLARQKALEAEARPLGERLYAEKAAAYTHRLAGYWQAWQSEQSDS